MSSSTIVYIVDATGSLGNALEALLNRYNIEVVVIPDSGAYLRASASSGYDNSCVLYVADSDCVQGVSVVDHIHRLRPYSPIIVLCDTLDDALKERYAAVGATDVVSRSMVDAYTFTRLADLVPGGQRLPQTQPATMRSPDGTAITIRMMTPDDSEMERQFVIGLSGRSRYLRFFSGFKALPEYVLKQLVDIQFPISYALIATVPSATGEEQIGVARYAPTKNSDVAEFAVVVADEWQGCGVASQLLSGVFTAATVAGISRLEGLVLRENTPMLNLAKKLGFSVSPENGSEEDVLKVYKDLR